MAKNWTIAEAVVVIKKGTDLEAIQDIGRRFPIVAVMLAGGEKSLVHMLSKMPDYLTTRKVESHLKGEIEDAVEEVEETPAPKKKAAVVAEPAKKAKKAVVEEDDEDEEPAPKKKAKKVVVEEDDEDEEPAPKKKAKKAKSDDDDWDL